jgi:ribosomal protein L37AE/L43A
MNTLLNPRLHPTLSVIDSLDFPERRDKDSNRSVAATSYNLRTCEHCGHDLRAQLPAVDAQLWACHDCGEIRQWGDLRPADEHLRPVLGCDNCEAVTRHRFVRVEGR